MKLKSGLILRKCGKAEIVVPVGANVEQFKNMMVTISGSGRILWGILAEGCEENKLVDIFLSKFEGGIDRAMVEKDVDAFVTKLRGAGLLDE